MRAMKFIFSIPVLLLSCFGLQAQTLNDSIQMDTINMQGRLKTAGNLKSLFNEKTDLARLRIFMHYFIAQLETGDISTDSLDENAKFLGFRYEHYILNSLTDTSQLRIVGEKLQNSLIGVQSIPSKSRARKVRCYYVLSMQIRASRNIFETHVFYHISLWDYRRERKVNRYSRWGQIKTPIEFYFINNR